MTIPELGRKSHFPFLSKLDPRQRAIEEKIIQNLLEQRESDKQVKRMFEEEEKKKEGKAES